ncbi:Uma2 family endonuclease [Saccharopolyspora sp. ASAGF58]|uniref:Uma2 family endonuclease n=1 Tax=Saccharopolyspora TaxID=1835 RepID=UPI00143FC6C2|nr:Uma2 family endonuclease [Saccharopolyspora sp. ASAGF58]QIZ34752.1 Uma2 family endonuclease [Saccharopolyspora sp. ASAGF58]
MTAVPKTPHHLLTVAEYAELGEDDRHRYELQEGSLVVSPSPSPDHGAALLALATQIAPQLPRHLEQLLELDVDLALVPADRPGFVRRPDLIVVDRKARQRVRQDGGLLRASEVVVVVEVVSPGSRRIDHVIKRDEYADAGIPHYWIVDLDEPVSLLACHLAEPFGYQDPGDVAGEFVTEVPFPVRLRLDELVE